MTVRDQAKPGDIHEADGSMDAALLRRLRVVAAALGLPVDSHPSATDTAVALVEHVRLRRLRDEVWLLLVALQGGLPGDDAIDETVRTLRLADSADVLHELMADVSATSEDAQRDLLLVGDRAVVDVDFTARHDLHTGIQRVVRETLPRWHSHEVQLVAWNRERHGLRELDSDERDRVLRFRGASPPVNVPSRADVEPLVVPWHTTIVLPEVPGPDLTDRIAGSTAANRLVLVGYDCIPVVSADVLPPEEPVKFVRYLSMVKRADAVAAISGSAADEFRGFCSMLPTQGLTGPTVVACHLPAQAEPAHAASATPPVGRSGPRWRTDPTSVAAPYVLVVGSHDPRKNHLAVLHAAERMWLAGERFRLVFAGSRGWKVDDFDRVVRRLRRRRWPLEVRRGLGDPDLWRLYGAARYTVFPSVHEGFGLPVAESLAAGVPCITSRFGSMGEIASGGGALTVDPFDDEELHDAMRRLLTDDVLHRELVRQSAGRHDRSWQQYADELWSIVDGVSS